MKLPPFPQHFLSCLAAMLMSAGLSAATPPSVLRAAALPSADSGFFCDLWGGNYEWLGTMELRIYRVGENLPVASVDYAVIPSQHQQPSATPFQDYMPVSGTVHFAAGESVKRVPFTILDDSEVEGSEWIAVSLSGAVGTPIGGAGRVELPIYDNERGFFFMTFGNDNENAGEREIVVRREGSPLPAASVDYAVTASRPPIPVATPGLDFTPVIGTLAFAAGETQKSFRVPILNDALEEGNEYMAVALSNPRGTPIEGNGRFDLTIVDNELGYLLTEFAGSEEGYRLIREQEAEVHISVGRWGDYQAASTVDYRIEAFGPDDPYPAATPGEDFEAASGTLAFAAGQTAVNLPIRLHADTRPEDDEMFRVVLLNPSAGVSIGSQEPAVFTILDRQRLLARVDPDFQPVAGTAFSRSVSLPWVLLPDGRSFLASFGSLSVDALDIRLSRLRADGSPDPAFAPATLQTDSFLKIQPLSDGGVLVSARAWNQGPGEFQLNGETARVLARLRADGTRDADFHVELAVSLDWVTALAATPDGHIAVAGWTDEGTRLFWLNPRGALANPQPVEFDDEVRQLLALPDGSVLAHGAFWKVGEREQRRLARILPGGRADPDYRPLPPEFELHYPGDDNLVLSSAGPLLLARSLDPSGRGTDSVHRLLPAGGLDPSFLPYRAAPPLQIANLTVDAGKIYLERRREQGPQRLVSLGLDGQRSPSQPPEEIAFREFLSGTKSPAPSTMAARTTGELLVYGPALVNGHLRFPQLTRLLPQATTPRVEAALESARVSESAGLAQLNLWRIGSDAAAWTVRWATADRTARAGVDYQSAGGEVTFPSGQSAATISLTVLDNAAPDEERALRLRFTTVPDGQKLPEVEITIVNDDLGFLPNSLAATPFGTFLIRPTGHLVGARPAESSVYLESSSDFWFPENDRWLSPFEREFLYNDGEYLHRFFRLRREE